MTATRLACFLQRRTRLLDGGYHPDELNKEMGPDSTMVSDMLNKIFDNAVFVLLICFS